MIKLLWNYFLAFIKFITNYIATTFLNTMIGAGHLTAGFTLDDNCHLFESSSKNPT